MLTPIDCGNTEWKKLNGNNFVLTIPAFFGSDACRSTTIAILVKSFTIF
jgi:hypothetical protein